VPAERIVSLVPSLTELVFWLGAGDRLVGRTRFCTEPAREVEKVPAIGGTKNPKIDRIVASRPHLVIANKEENRREDIEALEAAGVTVYLSQPDTVFEAIEMIRELGELCSAATRADELARDIEVALEGAAPAEPVRTYVAVWHNPMMGLGSNSYGHSLLESCGARNVLGHRERYPELTIDELRALEPELILLPDEPFPFDESHAELYSEIAPARVVDGKLLWWYGPRMPQAIRELRQLFRGVRA
jgi:ABC-type hemin transport system substrate-binding protein